MSFKMLLCSHTKDGEGHTDFGPDSVSICTGISFSDLLADFHQT